MMTAEETPVPEKKPSKLQTILVIVAVLVVEAVAIVGILLIVTGPASVDASHVPALEEIAADERIVETLILDARLPNARSGITFLYDTEIYVQTKQRHVERIRRELDQFTNEIRAEISAIWRTAEPHHFQEPRLENLTRKVHALLNERFGLDPDTAEPIVTRCVIVMGTGFRIDS